MHDQRIEARPPLGLEDTGHGAVVARIPAQPVNRLGRKRDQPAIAQNLGRAGMAGLVGGKGSVSGLMRLSDAAFWLLAEAASGRLCFG